LECHLGNMIAGDRPPEINGHLAARPAAAMVERLHMFAKVAMWCPTMAEASPAGTEAPTKNEAATASSPVFAPPRWDQGS
jgi:hypothetical protein